MKTHQFIIEEPLVGQLGLYRMFQDNILVRMGTPSKSVTTELIEKEVNHVLSTIDDDGYHSIIDIRYILHTSKDTRAWMKSDLSKQVIKSYAIVAESWWTSIIASISLKLHGLEMPNKKFRNFDVALQWTVEQQDLLKEKASASNKAA